MIKNHRHESEWREVITHESCKPIAEDMGDLCIQLSFRTGIDKEVCQIFVHAFFAEIVNCLLQGAEIRLAGLWRMFVSSPRLTDKKTCHIAFFPLGKFAKMK